jgi:hypothetical protein
MLSAFSATPNSSPNSLLTGATLQSICFTDLFQAKDHLPALASHSAFVPLTPRSEAPLRKVRALLAFTILAAVIAVSALDLAPIFAASSSLMATLLIHCFRSF